MARILMVNVPYAGHVNPTLPLAASLVKRGHAVTYINAPEWRAKIEATGAAFFPYLDYPESLSEQQKKRRCFLAAGRTVLSIGKEYDLLLYEMFFFPAKALADRLGIPAVRQFSQPAWNEATVPYAMSVSRLWRLSCWLINAQVFGKSTAAQLNMRGKRLADSVLSDTPALNIVYVPEAFQPLRDTFDERFLFTSPILPEHPAQERSFRYDAMKRPLIYISLGSILSNRGFCKECIRAFGGKALSVILSTGKVDPATLGVLPENIIALPFVPQQEVLRHANLFITHGGMNSVNEAMFYGVPMLVMPVLNDQPMNAAQVVRLGIGRKMRPYFTHKRMLYANAMAVLSDEGIRANSMELRDHLAAEPGMEKALKAIEGLLNGGRKRTDGGGERHETAASGRRKGDV